MATNGTLVKLQTKCRVPTETGPCGHTVTHFPMDAIPIIGQPAGKKVAELVMALMGHLQKKHPDIFVSIQAMGSTFMGFLALRLFETSDAALLAACDQTQAHLRQLSTLQFSDESVEATIRNTLRKALAAKHTESEIATLCAELQPVLTVAMRGVRDALTGAVELPRDQAPPA